MLVLAFVAAAVGAVSGAPHARPLGLIAGGFVLSSGVLGVARFVHHEMYERFADLGIEQQLNLLSFVSSLLMGPVVIAVLARKGVERSSGGLPGPWGGDGPWGVRTPGHQPPGAPGFAPGAPGAPPAHAPAPAPGFGPPPASPPPGR